MNLLSEFIPGNISVTLPSAARYALARRRVGSYQAAVLRNRARWSGADLRGRARKWSAHYARSRRGIVREINEIMRGAGSRWRLEPHREGRAPIVLRWTRV